MKWLMEERREVWDGRMGETPLYTKHHGDPKPEVLT
jgi:hypothetical protein